MKRSIFAAIAAVFTLGGGQALAGMGAHTGDMVDETMAEPVELSIDVTGIGNLVAEVESPTEVHLGMVGISWSKEERGLPLTDEEAEQVEAVMADIVAEQPEGLQLPDGVKARTDENGDFVEYLFVKEVGFVTRHEVVEKEVAILDEAGEVIGNETVIEVAETEVLTCTRDNPDVLTSNDYDRDATGFDWRNPEPTATRLVCGSKS